MLFPISSLAFPFFAAGSYKVFLNLPPSFFLIIGICFFALLFNLRRIACLKKKRDTVLSVVIAFLIVCLFLVSIVDDLVHPLGGSGGLLRDLLHSESALLACCWLSFGVYIVVASFCLLRREETPGWLMTLFITFSATFIALLTFFIFYFGIINGLYEFIIPMVGFGLYCLYLRIVKPEGSITATAMAFLGLTTGLLAIHIGVVSTYFRIWWVPCGGL